MHAVWCISVLLQIHLGQYCKCLLDICISVLLQIHLGQYCKCTVDNWQPLVLHRRFLQFSMYHTNAPLWYHSYFTEGVVCQSISLWLQRYGLESENLANIWESNKRTDGGTRVRNAGLSNQWPFCTIMKFSFATSQVLHKQEISCMTFTCQSKSPQTKWARSSGTWCALQLPCVYGFSPLWNNKIYVQCVLHASLSQYTSCSVMWWRMRRGVNMLAANELAAAAPSSLSLISLFRFQPSTPFRVYLLSTKIDSTDRCVP